MKSPGGGSGMPPPEEPRFQPQGQPQGQPFGQPTPPGGFRSILPMDPNQVAQLTDQPRMEGATAPPPLLGAGQPPAAAGGMDDEKMKLALMIARMQQSKDIGQQRNATMLGGDPSKNIGYTGG